MNLEFEPLNKDEQAALVEFRQRLKVKGRGFWLTSREAEYIQSLLVREWLTSQARMDRCKSKRLDLRKKLFRRN